MALRLLSQFRPCWRSQARSFFAASRPDFTQQWPSPVVSEIKLSSDDIQRYRDDGRIAVVAGGWAAQWRRFVLGFLVIRGLLNEEQLELWRSCIDQARAVNYARLWHTRSKLMPNPVAGCHRARRQPVAFGRRRQDQRSGRVL